MRAVTEVWRVTAVTDGSGWRLTSKRATAEADSGGPACDSRDGKLVYRRNPRWREWGRSEGLRMRPTAAEAGFVAAPDDDAVAPPQCLNDEAGQEVHGDFKQGEAMTEATGRPSDLTRSRGRGAVAA